MPSPMLSRRQACQAMAGAFVAAACAPGSLIRAAAPGDQSAFHLRYLLASALFGKMPLAEILPQVKKTGSDAIDIWCLVHGNQREQLAEMGVEKFATLLQENGVKLGSFTSYPLGPFGLEDEIELVNQLGGRVIVTGTPGPKNPSGADAQREMRAFLEKMKPHAEAAAQVGVTLALENHADSLLAHPDSLRAFAEMNTSPSLGVAFAPHHLHPWAAEIPALIEHLSRHVAFFYAQEHGKGSKSVMPKADEMLQLPGFGGGLDYRPIVAALKKINFTGWTEIFMHPFPRGVAILPTPGEIAAAVNKSREYLEKCVAEA